MAMESCTRVPLDAAKSGPFAAVGGLARTNGRSVSDSPGPRIRSEVSMLEMFRDAPEPYDIMKPEFQVN